MTRYLFALVLATTTTQSLGFVPASTTCNKHTSTSTKLDLTTSESHKLVAFSQHYLSNKAKGGKGSSSNLTSSRRRTQSANDANTHSRGGVVTAARNVITRLVGHEDKQTRNKDTSLQSTSSTSIEEVVHNFLLDEDEVVYPITGFTLVDGHAVPTPEQQAACNLYLQCDEREEEVFGTWTSPQGGDALWM
eukprot:1012199_1